MPITATGQWLATLSSSTSTSYLEGSNSLMSTPRYDKDELAALIEYGLTDHLTGILNPGLQHIDIAAPTNAERTGLGYTEFGARYGFFEAPTWVVSGQATLRIPGTTDIANPAAIGYTDVEADFRALLGHNFKIADMPAFFDVEVAERVRTAGAPSEFRVDGTLGVKVLRGGCCWCRASMWSRKAPARRSTAAATITKSSSSARSIRWRQTGGCKVAAFPPMPAATRCRRTV